MASINLLQSAVLILGGLVLYIACLSAYRLFFHPLRQVPGPKLCALTAWVETYYDCFKAPGGQFMWEYEKWHERYGPIVRIGPDEVHIQDPAFYDVFYSQSRHSHKLEHLQYRFDNELSAFSTADHEAHRLRRGALNPFFSKRKIGQHAPQIQALMDRVCKRVKDEYFTTGTVLIMNNMWGAFAADNVVSYCLEKPYDFIMYPNFRAAFSDATYVLPSTSSKRKSACIALTAPRSDLVKTSHFLGHFPWMLTALQMLPDWLVVLLSPSMKSVNAFRDEMEAQILRAKAANAAGGKPTGEPLSLFTALLQSDLPASELGLKRLRHEALSVIGAGVETTTHALSNCTFHILANPPISSRLMSELEAAIPNPNRMIDLDALMQLPYLTCVINEALRFSYGPVQRLPRRCPAPVVYTSGKEEYVLPPGYIISMDNFFASHDATVFPEPFEFRPERWENNPVAPDGRPLTRYLIAFGRGTRSCLGMQLAYAELYIGIATFFRRFTSELFETQRDAIDCYMDMIVPRPKPGTKGIRVTVKAVA